MNAAFQSRCDGTIAALTVPRFAYCLMSRLPDSRTHVQKITVIRWPQTLDSCEPAVSVRQTCAMSCACLTANRAFAVYWICTVNLSLPSLKGNAVLDSKGLD
jgi:hypothetical protein